MEEEGRIRVLWHTSPKPDPDPGPLAAPPNQIRIRVLWHLPQNRSGSRSSGPSPKPDPNPGPLAPPPNQIRIVRNRDCEEA